MLLCCYSAYVLPIHLLLLSLFLLLVQFLPDMLHDGILVHVRQHPVGIAVHAGIKAAHALVGAVGTGTFLVLFIRVAGHLSF